MTEGLQPLYPITPFLSPPRIYAQGLNPNLSPLGLIKYGPIFSIRENAKTSQVQLSFSIKY